MDFLRSDLPTNHAEQTTPINQASLIEYRLICVLCGVASFERVVRSPVGENISILRVQCCLLSLCRIPKAQKTILLPECDDRTKLKI